MGSDILEFIQVNVNSALFLFVTAWMYGEWITHILIPHVSKVVGLLYLLTGATTLVFGLHCMGKYSSRDPFHEKVCKCNLCANGMEFDRSQIVFASTGLAAKWYATYGAKIWNHYEAVVFDEIDQMSKDPEYALLWESASKEHVRRVADNRRPKDNRIQRADRVSWCDSTLFITHIHNYWGSINIRTCSL